MKKSIVLFLFIIAVNTILASNYFPFAAEVISKELETNISMIEVDVYIKFSDTLTWNIEPVFNLPENWLANSITNFEGQTFYPNDEIIYTFELTYNLDSLPFFPERMDIIFPLNEQKKTTIGCNIYFTPYNTVEIWNLIDFYYQPRRWLIKSNHPNAQRIDLSKQEIPPSNINWEQVYPIDREDDNEHNFQPVRIPGLAYEILMDIEEEEEPEGDKGKRFTGEVTGQLVTWIYNDFDEMVIIPLAGIKY